MTTTLGAHVTPYDDASQTMFMQLRAGFMAAGADAVTATERAYATLGGMVARQAAIVSFVGLFQLLGVLFLALIPLVVLMRAARAGGGPAAHWDLNTRAPFSPRGPARRLYLDSACDNRISADHRCRRVEPDRPSQQPPTPRPLHPRRQRRERPSFND
jgi:hypothetical protein